jgi:alkylation response protein AidB-like acyl-CoA dehydrogenase
VRALEASPDGFDRDVWRAGCELGWTSQLVGEADGGGSISGHGLLDAVLVSEELGRAVAPGPFVPCNVVAYAIAMGGTPEQKQRWLPGLISGDVIGAWVFPGHPVEAGAQADVFLVGDRLVAADSPAVDVTPMQGLDLTRRFATVTVADGAGEPLVVSPTALLQIAVALQSAETCGVVDRVFHMTLDYMGDRYSFGRPIASYQALKHRMADNKMQLEACHAIATAAARAIAHQREDASELMFASKAYIGPIATEIVQDCVQLHGGIGVTWEHDIHLYLRRATVNRSLYGTPIEHRDRLAGAVLGVA